MGPGISSSPAINAIVVRCSHGEHCMWIGMVKKSPNVAAEGNGDDDDDIFDPLLFQLLQGNGWSTNTSEQTHIHSIEIIVGRLSLSCLSLWCMLLNVVAWSSNDKKIQEMRITMGTTDVRLWLLGFTAHALFNSMAKIENSNNFSHGNSQGSNLILRIKGMRILPRAYPLRLAIFSFFFLPFQFRFSCVCVCVRVRKLPQLHAKAPSLTHLIELSMISFSLLYFAEGWGFQSHPAPDQLKESQRVIVSWQRSLV